MTWISTSVLFLPYSKLYILTELSSNDVKFIPVETLQNIYSYGTVNSIFVEIQPDSANIKNDPRMMKCITNGLKAILPCDHLSII